MLEQQQEDAKSLPGDTKVDHDKEREGTWKKMMREQQEAGGAAVSTKEQDPWRKARAGGLSEGWQPKGWTPSAGAKR